MSTTFLATAPDGSIHTRKSDRTYTHCIVARGSYSAALAEASKLSPFDAKNFNYFVECVELGDKHPQASVITAQSFADRARTVELYKTADNYAEAMRVGRIARVEANKAAGVYRSFGALTWCGRIQLAVAQLNKYRAQAGYEDVTMVAVAIKPKKERSQDGNASGYDRVPESVRGLI